VDEQRFYELIETTRDTGQTASADPDQLSETLEELSDDEVSGFAEQFTLQHQRLNSWRVWGAGYVAAGGMSDDSYHYFKSWIVGAGAAAVARALTDPDGLVEFFGDDDELENEELEYVAPGILDDRELPDPREQVATAADPVGDPFDEDTVDSDYPRLAAWAAQQG
jgi:hypothetical protein